MNFYPPFMVIHPLSSICIEQYILKFDLVNNFSVDHVGFTYKLGQHFFIYRLEKFTLYKGSYFCWCNFSIKLSFLQRREKKRNTTLYDRYYLQTCKAVTFEKITNHAKYKQSNIPGQLYIFCMNSDKANCTFLYPFCCWG